MVFEELRGLAERNLLCDPAGDTLNATGLVHEAWLKIHRTIGKVARCTYSDRQYYGIVAQAMRRVLIDRSRKKRRMKKIDSKLLRVRDPRRSVLGVGGPPQGAGGLSIGGRVGAAVATADGGADPAT